MSKLASKAARCLLLGSIGIALLGCSSIRERVGFSGQSLPRDAVLFSYVDHIPPIPDGARCEIEQAIVASRCLQANTRLVLVDALWPAETIVTAIQVDIWTPQHWRLLLKHHSGSFEVVETVCILD